ncbi:hypothetical protein GmHk_17G049517 [Glycine max]|nr:hypothetical protein GmHk_17G049517 [Glycine max]
MGSPIHYQFVAAFHNDRVTKYHNIYFFTDGLKFFRKDYNIHESVTITFTACEGKSIFSVNFMPPLHKQTCGRPLTNNRKYVWTVEITETMISAPQPLVVPPSAMRYLVTSTQHMTIVNKKNRLQWNLSVCRSNDHPQPCITTPWYEFLRHGNYRPEDEICFYFITFQNNYIEVPTTYHRQWVPDYPAYNYIEVPLTYHRQWYPHYPSFVVFNYNGINHFIIRLRKYGERYFFADGLNKF